MVLRLQVLLHCGDHQDQEVTIFVDKEGACEVADALNQDILALSKVDSWDMTKAGIVSEHLNVDGPDEQLFELLLWNVTLSELGLETLSLKRDNFVFLLLGAGLSNRLDQVKELLGQMTTV